MYLSIMVTVVQNSYFYISFHILNQWKLGFLLLGISSREWITNDIFIYRVHTNTILAVTLIFTYCSILAFSLLYVIVIIILD